jgi:hypothetical protein
MCGPFALDAEVQCSGAEPNAAEESGQEIVGGMVVEVGDNDVDDEGDDEDAIVKARSGKGRDGSEQVDELIVYHARVRGRGATSAVFEGNLNGRRSVACQDFAALFPRITKGGTSRDSGAAGWETLIRISFHSTGTTKMTHGCFWSWSCVLLI